MSRATTWIAVAAGALFGGALGWPSQSREGGAAPSATQATQNAPSESPPPEAGPVAESSASAPPTTSATASAAASAAPSPSAEITEPELTSPHSRPVKTEGELRAAEVNCDSHVADDCIRAADGYLNGIVARDEERISRHRKVGLTLYVHQCEAFDPVACYQMSRLYADGDIVEKNAATAQALVKRALELCQYKTTPACIALKQSAGQ